MDQTFEELRLQRSARLQRAPYMRAWKKALGLGHRALLLVLAGLFLVRTAGQAVFGGLQFVVLAPYAALACLVFRVWALDKKVCGQELDVGRVYAAFWAGEPLVLGTGLESFFLGCPSSTAEINPVRERYEHEHVHRAPMAAVDAAGAGPGTLSKQQVNALKRMANHLKRDAKREAKREAKQAAKEASKKRRFRRGKGAQTIVPTVTCASATATLPRHRFFRKRKS